MDRSLTPETQETLIENALSTYPIVSLPHDLTEDVMRRLQTVPPPRPFRLTWKDLILAIGISIWASATWFSISHLPPLLVAQIRKESILLYQQMLVNMRWLLPILSFGLAAFLAALTIPYLRQELKK